MTRAETAAATLLDACGCILIRGWLDEVTLFDDVQDEDLTAVLRA